MMFIVFIVFMMMMMMMMMMMIGSNMYYASDIMTYLRYLWINYSKSSEAV